MSTAENPAEILRARVEAWRRDLRPRDSVEASLAEQAAALSLELEHVAAVAAARDAHHARTAPKLEADRAHREVIAAGHELIGPATDEWVYNHMQWHGRRVGRANSNPQPIPPELAVHELEATAGGCRWMAGHWAELAEILEQGLTWREADERRAIRLLGRAPDADADTEVRNLRLAVRILGRSERAEVGPLLVPPRAEEIGRPVPTRAEAEAELLDICMRAAGRLRALAAVREAAANSGGPGEAARHGLDPSKEGEALRRRQSTIRRELLKTLEMLARLQKRPAAEGSPSSGPATSSHGHVVGCAVRTIADDRCVRRTLRGSDADDAVPRPVPRERVRARRLRLPTNPLADRGLTPIRRDKPPGRRGTHPPRPRAEGPSQPEQRPCSARTLESAPSPIIIKPRLNNCRFFV